MHLAPLATIIKPDKAVNPCEVLRTSLSCALCRVALERTGQNKLLLAYPNSGENYESAQGGWDGQADLTAEEFGTAALQWADAGASLIGGCCRTNPDHIQSIAARVI